MRWFLFVLPFALGLTAKAQSGPPSIDAADLTVCDFVADRAATTNIQYLQSQEQSPFRQDFTVQGGYLDIDGDGVSEQLSARIEGNIIGPGFQYGHVNGIRPSNHVGNATSSPDRAALSSVLAENYLRHQMRSFAWLPFSDLVYGIQAPGFGLWQPRLVEEYSSDGSEPVCVLEPKIELTPYHLFSDYWDAIDLEQSVTHVDRQVLCERVSSVHWDEASSNEAENTLRPTDDLTEADIERLFDVLERRRPPEDVERLRAQYAARGGEGLPWLGDSVGGLVHDGANVLTLDWDNDGDEDRLVWLRIDAASASGCSSSYWELLPASETGLVDEDERTQLLEMQGVAPDESQFRYPICWQRNHWRSVHGRAYLERVGIRAPQTQTVYTVIDGEAAKVCQANISLSFDVIFDRDRDIWPVDVRAGAAVLLNDIQEQSNQETLPE